MSAYTPHFAPVVVLLFLGTVSVTGITLLVLFYGAVRRSEFFANLGEISALVVTVGYGLVLCGVSIASSEKVLPPGGWKYFCEIDCHIAYSLIAAQTCAALGPEMQQISARRKFVVVRAKTWFDDTGRSFAPSAESQAAFARLGNTSTPFTEPLRPGESYTTDFVFDVPKDARGLRLLIAGDDPETRLMIGHENSLLHKKIYFGVAFAPPLTQAAQ